MTHAWTHAWCKSPARDESVRAAEDGRTAPLPTLEEAIASPFAEAAERSVPVSKTGEGQSGIRTERVVLEVTHDSHLSLRDWPSLRTFFGESVRVVEEPESTDIRHRWDRDGERCLKCRDKDWMGGPCSTTDDEYIAALTAERDAAIRERDAAVARAAEDARAYAAESDARAQAQRELQDCCDTEFVPAESAGSGAAARLHRETWLRLERDELITQRDELISRVAELEAQAKSLREDAAASARLMYSANSDCIDAQAERDTLQARVAALEAASGEADSEDADIGYALRLFVDGRRVMSHELDRQQAAAFVISADHLAKYIRDEYQPPVDEAAQAASGGGDGEVANVTFHAGDSAERARYVGMTVKPLRKPQPRGWLTQEERNGLGEIATYLDTRADCRLQGLGSMVRVILTRSTPPEVVLPDADCSWCSDYATVWRECLEAVRSSLAAAGVAVKEAT